MVLHDSTKIGTCFSCLMLAEKIQMLNILILVLIAVIFMDLFFIWRRCNIQRKRIQKFRDHLKKTKELLHGTGPGLF